MSRIFTKLAVFGLLIGSLLIEVPTDAFAQGCLGPGQQRKAISSGQARPFGSIASRIGGELVGARLCQRGGRLVYIVTILRGNRRVDAIFDAKSGRQLK